MKKFKLSRIQSPAPDGLRQKSRMYSVFLAPGVKHYFSSYKAARSFTAEYNRQVNQSLGVFNLLLGQLYGHYRSAWFYFYHSDLADHSAIDQEILNHIHQGEIWLHRSIFNTNGTYTGGMVYAHLNNICQAISAGSTKLAAFLNQRRIYAQSDQLEYLARQAQSEYCRISQLYFEKT